MAARSSGATAWAAAARTAPTGTATRIGTSDDELRLAAVSGHYAVATRRPSPVCDADMIEIVPDLAPVLCLGVLRADGVVVRPEAPEVWEEIERLAARLRSQYAGQPPGEIPALRPARELYRRTGEDPTKTRPSSEALLRRILRGERLSRINSLVDLSNLCSLEFLLPIGLYDADQIRGTPRARLGAEGEGYDSLGKGFFSARGRLTLYDNLGPFGSPTNDSRRTAITAATRRCLMVIFAPGTYARETMGGHAQAAAARLRQFAGAADVDVQVVGGAEGASADPTSR